MKNLRNRKGQVLLAVSAILFLTVSILSLISITQLRGNARVINYDGIIRGATQKLMKMEIQNAHSGGVDEAARDKLRDRLDRILYALETGKGEDSSDETLSNIIALPDETHSQMIKGLTEKWDALKYEIEYVRAETRHGVPHTASLYTLSEEYFKLANDTVFAAEAYSESQVHRSMAVLAGVLIVFVVIAAAAGVYIVRGIAVRRKAEVLGKIAYIDPLTKLDNRASCERLIDKLKEDRPREMYTVLMFDMNNLKLTNDFLGHQGGDVIIRKFAEILSDEAKDYGFIGRYGGDEFLGIFRGADKDRCQRYLSKVGAELEVYNNKKVNVLEKISYAVGMMSGYPADYGIDAMIFGADKAMYANKRKIKNAAMPE
ncbi:MAG: diguanylate cyclase [Oscillospiraceae bacterium]|jgi:diguanylate cyclase (GGDEF)-like protein|nr:diguanylate cyclase [Oscillospiraceae bacterium]